MERTKLLIRFAGLVLMAASLACSLFNGRVDLSDGQSPAEQTAESAASQKNTDPNAHTSDIQLGTEYRSEQGGYGFQLIPDYELEEFFGLTSMTAPEADPNLGPIILLIGGSNEEEATPDDLFSLFMQDAEGEHVQIFEQREIIVDGKPGILAQVSGEADGLPMVGRVVVVAVTPIQQFSMFASAPKDRWNEVAPQFDAVLASVFFFEPQEIEILGDLEEDAQPEVAPPEADADAFLKFPTAANQLPPGGFAYLMASDDGSLPTIVNQGTLKNQSTSAEYILELASMDEQNALTLFIPLQVTTGTQIMSPYLSDSTVHAPGAIIYKEFTFYNNTDGIIVIEEMQGNTISGMVAFTAIDENGNQLSVTGFFNQLPLTAP